MNESFEVLPALLDGEEFDVSPLIAVLATVEGATPADSLRT